VRLISTGTLLQTYSDEEIQVDWSKLMLSGTANDPSRGLINAYIDPNNNLPTSIAYCHSDADDAATAIQACLASVHQANHNLSDCFIGTIAFLYMLAFKKSSFSFVLGL
jgi:hypothetical protein